MEALLTIIQFAVPREPGVRGDSEDEGNRDSAIRGGKKPVPANDKTGRNNALGVVSRQHVGEGRESLTRGKRDKIKNPNPDYIFRTHILPAKSARVLECCLQWKF